MANFAYDTREEDAKKRDAGKPYGDYAGDPADASTEEKYDPRTGQRSVSEGLPTSPDVKNVFPLDPFESVVNSTFPNPEIVRLNFNKDDNGELESIYVKVLISGDFIMNEWFWKDFGRYFKVKVYLVPARS